ncbi:MAG: DNA double-strand break repair nuclease NurA [Candidatus Sericytochromatia bacterium]
MLDLAKLNTQMRQAAFELRADLALHHERKKQAQTSWQNLILRETELLEKGLKAGANMPWSLARPLEPLAYRGKLPEIPETHIVLATDGSQITPSRHEVSPCYLINIGLIRFIYGTGERPLQTSEPQLYYREQDLYTAAKRQLIGISEEQINMERSLKELEKLADLAEETQQKWPGTPALALIDGSLHGILPELSSQPPEVQNRIYLRLNQAFERIQAAQTPVCAYISLSRRSEVIQLLRLARCPFDFPNCHLHCSEGQEACEGLTPLPDRELWAGLLKPGERSPLFSTHSPPPEPLANQALCFFYLDCGSEIARLEVPRWVADHPVWLKQAQALVYAQVEKGRGYPIALAEAHNQAVIKGADRSQFYALLSRKLVEAQMGVSLSRKELKKRRGIV